MMVRILYILRLTRGEPSAEYEFHQYRVPVVPNVPASERHSSSMAKFLAENSAHALTPITEDMFGYSLTRPLHNQEYFYGIFDTCKKFNCGIESWHTESGPGVFEAVRTAYLVLPVEK